MAIKTALHAPGASADREDWHGPAGCVSCLCAMQMRVEQKKIIVRAIGDRVHDTMLACSCSMPSPVLLDVLCVRERLSERERERETRAEYVRPKGILSPRSYQCSWQAASFWWRGWHWQVAASFAVCTLLLCGKEKRGIRHKLLNQIKSKHRPIRSIHPSSSHGSPPPLAVFF